MSEFIKLVIFAMYFLQKQMLSAWTPLMVLITWVDAFDDTERAKTYLKIGFDLTPNSNGVPSLKIRRLEEDDHSMRRAVLKPSIRADSFSDSEEKIKADIKLLPNTNVKPVVEQSNEDSSLDNDAVRSTKGLRANEFDPDGNSKIHVIPSDESNDSDK
ncbi:uncharacterized protein [Battus philenor]|uniref:uncharacterized protein isoform X2 n=1 Tax=Battus philenor TaxID=42288 RepID=UPI0035CEB9C1